MSDDICVRLGARIRDLRTERGWRQIDLAQHAGIHEVHISNIERGATEIGFRHLVALAKAFDRSLSALVRRDLRPKAHPHLIYEQNFAESPVVWQVYIPYRVPRVPFMSTAVTDFAEQNLSSISGQRNAGLRKTAVKRLWHSKGVFVDAEHTYTGRAEIASAAGALLTRYPEYEFWPLEAVDSIPGVYRLTWAFGNIGLAPALTGVDVLRVEAQRIVAVYRFVNGAAF